MGNASKPITTPAPSGLVYTDPGVRTIRQLQTFQFQNTVTSAGTVATANILPLITQGNELWNGAFTASSLESLIELELTTTLTSTGGGNQFWVALFADYSQEALAVYPGGITTAAFPNTIHFKHYFQPVTLSPVRYSFRMAPQSNVIVANFYSYGGRLASRVTFIEHSGPSIR